MQLHSLPSLTKTRAKRLGQGYGSGKGGHTSSRGQKGQKARSKVSAFFVGTSWVWFKRLPFLRGKSRFRSLSPHWTFTLNDLNRLPSGSTVTPKLLIKHGFLPKSTSLRSTFKVVGTGELTKSLKVMLPVTTHAQRAITKAGGSVGGRQE